MKIETLIFHIFEIAIVITRQKYFNSSLNDFQTKMLSEKYVLNRELTTIRPPPIGPCIFI